MSGVFVNETCVSGTCMFLSQDYFRYIGTVMVLLWAAVILGLFVLAWIWNNKKGGGKNE